MEKNRFDRYNLTSLVEGILSLMLFFMAIVAAGLLF